MRNIWFTSDWHLGHKNILTFRNDDTGQLIRPEFSSVEEMNECLFDNYNETVKPGDKVYFLGDVHFDKKVGIKLKNLPGQKRLILGNHDDLGDGVLLEVFKPKKIGLWRIFKDHNVILSHVPLHNSSFRKVEYNVHGHIHEKESPSDFHINVCVEKTGYRPVHIDDVMSYKKT